MDRQRQNLYIIGIPMTDAPPGFLNTLAIHRPFNYSYRKRRNSHEYDVKRKRLPPRQLPGLLLHFRQR